MNSLSREDYTLENYKSVYEYYGRYKPNERTIRVAASLLRLIYNPEVTLDAETEKIVTEHAENGHPIIYASNHLRMDDQYVLGAAAWAVPALGKNIKKA